MTDSSEKKSPAQGGTAVARPAVRRKGLVVIASVVALGALAWGGWEWLVNRNYETTDNAYVAGHVVQVTPQVGGTVVAIGADDTDPVQAGQWLVQLDPADALVDLAKAEADLAQTARQVRSLYAGNAPLEAQVVQRQAELLRQQTDAARAQEDVQRRRALAQAGAVGQEEFDHARAQARTADKAVAAAQAAVRAAQAQLTAAQAQTRGSAASEHPSVLAAAARVREAYLALQRTRLLAPVSGQVAKRGVQLGQRVAAGAPLLTVVDLQQLWVDANFKESQLAALRVGQPVELVADVYGKQVRYHGAVQGLGAGTGAAFALLPAQNATGNWIKVVQRVPVRIGLDARELAAHPLRVGLSMLVRVDIRDVGATGDGAIDKDAVSADEQTNSRLNNAEIIERSAEKATNYDLSLPQAEQRIARIIAGENVAALTAWPGA